MWEVPPPDLYYAARGPGLLQAVDKVGKRVPHRKRLTAHLREAADGNYRQALHQVAYHLEGNAARADYHGGSELGDRCAVRAQYVPHAAARGKVPGKRVPLLAEPAEIDYPAAAGGGRGPGEIQGRKLLHLFKTGEGGHGMDQVIGCVDPGQRRRQALVFVNVALEYLHAAGPGAPCQVIRVLGQAAHRIALRQQPRDKPSADIAGRAGY